LIAPVDAADVGRVGDVDDVAPDEVVEPERDDVVDAAREVPPVTCAVQEPNRRAAVAAPAATVSRGE
jgi:hypothetical protein